MRHPAAARPRWEIHALSRRRHIAPSRRPAFACFGTRAPGPRRQRPFRASLRHRTTASEVTCAPPVEPRGRVTLAVNRGDVPGRRPWLNQRVSSFTAMALRPFRIFTVSLWVTYAVSEGAVRCFAGFRTFLAGAAPTHPQRASTFPFVAQGRSGSKRDRTGSRKGGINHDKVGKITVRTSSPPRPRIGAASTRGRRVRSTSRTPSCPCASAC